MNKIEILNSMKVVEYDADGEALIYLLVKNTEENKDKLLSIGVPINEINDLVDISNETIDISSFGFQYGGAEWYSPKSGWMDYIPE